jgi:hypothetical protein
MQRIVRCVSPFNNYFSFTAIWREIEMAKKMEMTREMEIMRELERGRDGDS